MTVRTATPSDLPALGRMAAALVRMHHAFDRERFFIVEPIEEGYARWLGKVLEHEDDVLVVACEGAEVIGYAYGGLQERNWMALLDARGST